MVMTNKERQAKFTKSQKAKGLIAVKLWIKPEWKQQIEKLINKLRGE